jgi:hypothetical protein
VFLATFIFVTAASSPGDAAKPVGIGTLILAITLLRKKPCKWFIDGYAIFVILVTVGLFLAYFFNTNQHYNELFQDGFLSSLLGAVLVNLPTVAFAHNSKRFRVTYENEARSDDPFLGRVETTRTTTNEPPKTSSTGAPPNDAAERDRAAPHQRGDAVSDPEAWEALLYYAPAVREAVDRLGLLSAKNVNEFRRLLMDGRDLSRVDEFEREAIRLVQGPAFAADPALRAAYATLNREDSHLGDELVRVVALLGNPKDLDQLIALIRERLATNRKQDADCSDKVEQGNRRSSIKNALRRHAVALSMLMFVTLSMLMLLIVGAIIWASSGNLTNDLVNDPKEGVCANALNIGRTAWDQSSDFSKYVAEAKRRGFTPDSCRLLIGK